MAYDMIFFTKDAVKEFPPGEGLAMHGGRGGCCAGTGGVRRSRGGRDKIAALEWAKG